MSCNRKRIPLLTIALGLALIVAGTVVSGRVMAQEGGVDHSVLPQLAGPFERPQEVTLACLECHPEAAKEVMATIHWTWETADPLTGQIVGKRHVLNNYCVAVPSNEPRCTSCHAGYGYADKTFDFSVEENVDCLVCHAQNGTYKKFPAGAGMPWLGDEPKEFPPGSGKMWEKVDLAAAAQSVALPTRANCGACHFFGGGGDAVKHGDLDTTMTNPSRELDVHMSPDGGNFSCQTCHQPEAHAIPGRIYNGEERVMCEDCHSGEEAPHQESDMADVLTTHTTYIACQTCHIPAFARGQATKLSWDWSTAGRKTEDGKPIIEKDENGNVIYHTKKGSFTWGSNVIPYYMWWNGNTYYLTVEDKINPSQVVKINTFEGSRGDGKIYPFKRFQGVQGYDTVNNVLLIPNLFPNNAEDTGAYWKSYDWSAAFASGMEYAGAEFSGEYDWVNTEMYWVQNHQVAPKENAVQCEECHTAEGGRLDFAALGYSEEEIAALTVFPPTLGQEQATVEPTGEPAADEPTVEPVTEEPAPEPQPESQTAAGLSGSATLWIAALVLVIVVLAAYFVMRRRPA